MHLTSEGTSCSERQASAHWVQVLAHSTSAVRINDLTSLHPEAGVDDVDDARPDHPIGLGAGGTLGRTWPPCVG